MKKGISVQRSITLSRNMEFKNEIVQVTNKGRRERNNKQGIKTKRI